MSYMPILIDYSNWKFGQDFKDEKGEIFLDDMAIIYMF